MVETNERGWFWPTEARRAHFDGGDGIALCGKWGRFGFAGDAPIQAGADSPPSRDDCATCRRKLDAEAASSEVEARCSECEPGVWPCTGHPEGACSRDAAPAFGEWTVEQQRALSAAVWNLRATAHHAEADALIAAFPARDRARHGAPSSVIESKTEKKEGR